MPNAGLVGRPPQNSGNVHAIRARTAPPNPYYGAAQTPIACPRPHVPVAGNKSAGPACIRCGDRKKRRHCQQSTPIRAEPLQQPHEPRVRLERENATGLLHTVGHQQGVVADIGSDIDCNIAAANAFPNDAVDPWLPPARANNVRANAFIDRIDEYRQAEIQLDFSHQLAGIAIRRPLRNVRVRPFMVD